MFEFIIIGAVGILFSVFGYLIMVKKNKLNTRLSPKGSKGH